MSSHNPRSTPVPCLATALTGPLQTLERLFLEKQCTIERWLRQEFQLTPPPFYCSVDIRNAGFKVAPVDTNLFPAGFNNLSQECLPLCIQAAQVTLEKFLPQAQRLLLIPENHTRNLYYLESVSTLWHILTLAGYEVRVGSMSSEVQTVTPFTLPSGEKIIMEPLQKKEGQLCLENFTPDLIILNNDLSGSLPEMLQAVTQPILPCRQLGWFKRLKSEHFRLYSEVAKEFSKELSIDPWTIDPLFRRCAAVNFMNGEGEECLYQHAKALFADIQARYEQYQIDAKPYITIKADAGSYGMGVMMADSPEALLNLNRKQRTKMSATKGGNIINQVLLQEGVYTFETLGEQQATAEPVVYMIGQQVVGGFYRVHSEKGNNDNLNSPGAYFEPLAFAKSCNVPDFDRTNQAGATDYTNRFYLYGVIARLALLAAAREVATLCKSSS